MSKGKKEKSLLDLITAENIQEVNSDKEGLEESIKRFNEVTEFLFATDEVQKVLKEKDKRIAHLEAKLAESESKVKVGEFWHSAYQGKQLDYDKVYAELRKSYDENEKLKQQLAEKETRIAELEDKDWYEGTIKQLEEQNERLIKQLTEKEKELYYKNCECEKWKADYQNCSRLEKLLTKERQYCLDNWRASEQDKISFCSEQVKKVRELYKKHLDYERIYDEFRVMLLEEDIENLILQLKEKK